MKTTLYLSLLAFLCGCGSTSGLNSSGSSSAGTRMESGVASRTLNSDVAEAVARGSTHGFKP